MEEVEGHRARNRCEEPWTQSPIGRDHEDRQHVDDAIRYRGRDLTQRVDQGRGQRHGCEAGQQARGSGPRLVTKQQRTPAFAARRVDFRLAVHRS